MAKHKPVPKTLYSEPREFNKIKRSKESNRRVAEVSTKCFCLSVHGNIIGKIEVLNVYLYAFTDARWHKCLDGMRY